MTNKNSDMEKNEVGKMGKILGNITSEGNTKSESINCKVTPAQKGRLKVEKESGGFKSLSEYIVFRLFDDAPVISLPEGRDILLKQSEIATLLHGLSVGDTHSSYDKIIEKISEIELSISQIFDYMDVIKSNFIDEKGDE